MRTVFYGVLLIIGFLLSAYAALFWQNNRDQPSPNPDTVRQALEHSIQWIQANETTLLEYRNPMLWWMVQQSARITQDERLLGFFAQYEKRVLSAAPNSPWQYLFHPHTWVPMQPSSYNDMPDYNRHFLYGLSCDAELGNMPDVQAQLKPDFCPSRHPISPACVTHQLMGMRFMLARGCGEPGAVSDVIAHLQHTIGVQLTWDVRVVDVYLQRVLMLLESGAGNRIKPVWVQRILAAQLSDGGWAGFQPLVPLGSERALGFSAKGFAIRVPSADFHATAQGLLLLSLLSAQTR